MPGRKLLLHAIKPFGLPRPRAGVIFLSPTRRRAIHGCMDQKRRLVALAEADGLSASELVRRLIDLHIEDRAANYRALHSIFGESRTSPKE